MRAGLGVALVGLVACVGCGRDPVAAITAMGGHVRVDKNGAAVKMGFDYNPGGDQVTDAGLEHLKGMTKLVELYFEGQKITDVGMAHLQGLVNLENLNLRRTQITDSGLVHLKGLTKLEKLYLFNTKVTDAGINKLQQALSKCRIFPIPSKS